MSTRGSPAARRSGQSCSSSSCCGRTIAILDEIDSGLDVDALKVVSEGINRVRESGETGVMLITHYTRILRYVKPDHVHVFSGGRIVERGGAELAEALEAEGYERYAGRDPRQLERTEPCVPPRRHPHVAHACPGRRGDPG